MLPAVKCFYLLPSTGRYKAVVLVLFLLFVALCSFVVPALLFFYMFCYTSIVVTVSSSCPLCLLSVLLVVL